MPFSRLVPYLLITATAAFPAGSSAQTAANSPPTAASANNASDHPLSLDRLVVSAGLPDKTAFDLAQGTSILTGEELHRRAQATLGDTLAATPGVSSTYYGPGASRPIIRGLGGDRIRVLDNGVGALDASNISPDHNAAIEPLFAERIEVLRGPATLLYGSSAVGGVVNVIDNRIPSAPLPNAVAGAFETRGFGAARERASVAALSGGNQSFRLQIDGLTLRTRDLRIPDVARSDEEAPADQPRGTLPNSDTATDSGSVGASWFFPSGRLGAAVSTYSTSYGVPVDEPISITMKQRRLDLAGETSTSTGIIRGVKARLGFGDYTHREIADRSIVNTTFENQAWEGRLELPHVFTSEAGGTFGLQASRSDFSAVGEEVVTPAYLTTTQALFALEEWKRGAIALQVGARYERQSIQLREFDDSALPVVAGYDARSGRKKTGRGVSGSVGVVYYPAPDWSIGASLAYTERLATAQELFSNGPHGGTGAYEVGTSNLGNERSVGVDLSIRRRAGFVTGTASVFSNTFKNYIFEQELDATIIAPEVTDGLTPYQYVAKEARFYGAEFELAFHLIDTGKDHLHLELMSDYVHAQQTTDDEPLPRTPPLRYGAAVRYGHGPWEGGIEVRRTMKQDRFTASETATAGFTLLNADLTYTVTQDRATFEFFARGTNLTDAKARVHSSFLKDFAPLAGRGVVGGVRLKF